MRINQKMRVRQKEAISETLALKAQKIIESELKLQQIKMNEIEKNLKKKQIYKKYHNKKVVPYKNADILSPMKNVVLRTTATEFGTSHRYY